MEKEIFLGKAGTKGEFFLKLENVINKPDYRVHKLVDRKGRKAMFYNYTVSYTHLTLPTNREV